MLASLRVRNFAIVEDAGVDFTDGLNVITGETGAGKSILVGALGLVLGERADKTMIRSGEDRCSVDAVFRLADPSAVNRLLDDTGADRCEQGELIIRRVVSASGSGKNFVNGCPVTVQTLKIVGDHLVDIHGPHDHQSLLNKTFQLDLLDAHGRLQKRRTSYETLYREMLDLDARRRALDCDDQEVARQIDVLAFQIKEIEQAELEGLDEESLENEYNIAANAQRVLELTSGIEAALSSSDESAFNSVASAIRLLSELRDIVPEAGDWHGETESVSVQLQELARTVSEYASRIDTDPGRMQWLEDRKSALYRLKSKHGSTVKEILDHLEKAKTALDDLRTRGERIAEIEKELAAVREKLESAGKQLSRARAKAAKALAETVTSELQGLGFPHGAFSVSLNAREPGPTGMDEIEFQFAPNAGEPMRPLRAIASSGEISRVMLAVKSVLAVHDRIPVLVFDEIDANVGGEMATAVGARLRDVAGSHQVLCITHLPQVAVHGRAHFVVDKAVRNGRTYTCIAGVEGRKRVEEVARMLGGKDMTNVTLKHAEEMLRVTAT
ncbi:MAG: DNA repair protein RecN [Kiritimatiellia bacterium]